MPGRRLSHDEQRLLEFWDNLPADFPRPLLRQLRVEGGPGLRGIRRLVVPFSYPLTAICGRNGVGKSTVLALAALSARPPADWPVYGAMRVPAPGRMFVVITPSATFSIAGGVNRRLKASAWAGCRWSRGMKLSSSRFLAADDGRGS